MTVNNNYADNMTLISLHISDLNRLVAYFTPDAFINPSDINAYYTETDIYEYDPRREVVIIDIAVNPKSVVRSLYTNRPRRRALLSLDDKRLEIFERLENELKR